MVLNVTRALSGLWLLVSGSLVYCGLGRGRDQMGGARGVLLYDERVELDENGEYNDQGEYHYEWTGLVGTAPQDW